MADKKDKAPKRSWIAWLLFAICATSSLLLAVAMVVMLLPQDLSDIRGYDRGAQGGKSRDLTSVLRESIDRGHEITLSEEEVNRWIGQNLKIRQRGLLGSAVKINGLAVRIRENELEIVVERSFFGLKSTQSMFMQVLVESDAVTSSKEVLLHGGPLMECFPPLKRGGRFGKLTVPQGYLYLVKPMFFQLGEVYKEELQMIFKKMHDIRLEDGKAVLNPRPPAISPNSP